MAYKLGFAGSRANLSDCKVELLCRLLESWYIPTTWTSSQLVQWFQKPNMFQHVCIPSPSVPSHLNELVKDIFEPSLPGPSQALHPTDQSCSRSKPQLGWDCFRIYFIGSNLFQCQFVRKLIIELLWTLVNFVISWGFHRISPWLTKKKHHKWIQMGCPVSKPS